MFLFCRRTSVVVLVYAFLIKDSKPLPAAGPQMEKTLWQKKKKKKMSYCAFCPLGQISLESCYKYPVQGVLKRDFSASPPSILPPRRPGGVQPPSRPFAFDRDRKVKKKEEKIHNHSPDNDHKTSRCNTPCFVSGGGAAGRRPGGSNAGSYLDMWWG